MKLAKRFFKISIVVLALIFVFGPVGISFADTSSGLVAVWHFDEGSGTSVSDSSGRNNHGTFVNMDPSTAWTPGQIGPYALDFSGLDNYVEIPDDPSLSGMDQLTITAWIKPHTLSGFRSVISKLNYTDPSFTYNLATYDNHVYSYLRGDGWEAGNCDYRGETPLYVDTWQHIALVYDGGPTTKMYVNGVEDTGGNSQTSRCNGSIRQTTCPVKIGYYHELSDHQDFDGLIDEVRMYNRALTAGDILELYQAGLTNESLTDLILYLPLDEGEGSTATDQSGFGNNGEIFGEASWTPGKTGMAVQFDGIDDYIDCGNDATLNPGKITVSAWVWSEASGQRQMISEKHTSVFQGGPASGWWLSKEADDRLTFLLHPAAGVTNEVEVKSSATLNTNEWIHIAATYDGTTPLVYINGEENTRTKTGSTTGDIYNSAHSLAIGRCRWCSASAEQYFNGKIDEFRIYNRSLSATEIQELYQEGLPIGLPILSISPPADIDFGTIDQCSDPVQNSFTLTNHGNADLIIEGMITPDWIELSGFSEGIIPPTESRTLTTTIIYSPPDAIIPISWNSGEVIIHSNDPSGDTRIAFKGFMITRLFTDDVTEFYAELDDDQVLLTWTNPSNADFKGTMIRYSETSYPTRNSGELVCDKENSPGSTDSCVHDIDPDVNNPLIYYSAFAYDDCGVYSIGRKVRSDFCTPIINNGDSDGKIDIVFMMAQDYNNDWDAFLSDVDDIIEKSYYADPIINANKNKINFWYSKKIATVNLINCFIKELEWGCKCDWQLPDNWREGCPHASVAAIVHTKECRDYALKPCFSSKNNWFGTFLHESGHAIFGLADEYDDAPDCHTSYKIRRPYPNIFLSYEDCKENSSISGNCDTEPFTTCKDGRWKAQPDDTIMSCDYHGYPSNICGWGPDGEPRVEHIFDQYQDPPVDPERKAFVGYFHYDGTDVTMYNATIVYGDVPERIIQWDDLNLKFLNTSSSVINNFTLQDPRYIDYAYPPGADLLNETNFTVVFPFIDNIKTLVIEDIKQGTTLASFDLSPTVHSFCKLNENDTQCKEYPTTTSTTSTSTTTTTSTSTSTSTSTTTTLPFSRVYGHVVTGQLFVPGASVTVTCKDTGVSVEGNADSRGMYSLGLPCAYGGGVLVYAESGPVRICLNPVLCLPYSGGAGVREGVISSAGYALVNVPLQTVSSSTTTSAPTTCTRKKSSA